MGKQRWTPPSSATPVESSNWAPPSTATLAEDESDVEKKSPSQNDLLQDSSGNFIKPHASSSDSADGSSLLEQGAATLNSASKGQSPVQTDVPSGTSQEEINGVPFDVNNSDQIDPTKGSFNLNSAISAPINTGIAKAVDAVGGVLHLQDAIQNVFMPESAKSKINQYSAASLFDWASNWLKQDQVNNPLPDNFAGKLVQGLGETVPTLVGAAVTGGAAPAEAALSDLGGQAGGYLSKTQLVQSALTKAAGPLTQYLAATGAGEGLKEGSDASGGQLLPTLLSGLKGGAKGVQEGVSLETQMGAGEGIGGGLFKLALKSGVVNEDGVITEQALKSLVGSPFAFAASSVADDVANGRPVNWQNAGVSAATALPFEAEHIVGAIDKSNAIEEQKQQLQAHIDNAVQSADANSIVNFGTADPQDIQTAMSRPESAQELQIMALAKGVEAQNAETIQEKNILHLAQLELQKQADIKSVGNTILDKGVQGFGDAVAQTQFPDPLKEGLQTNASLVNSNFNPEEVIKTQENDNLKEGIDQTQAHIDQLNKDNPAPVISADPAAINTLIDMVDHRTDLQEKLLDNTENENKPPEVHVDTFEQQLQNLGYDKNEIKEFTQEQKLHIIEHEVHNEGQQGIIPEQNEASTNGANTVGVEPGLQSAENITGENGGVPQDVTSTTDAAYAESGAESLDSSRSLPVGNPFAVQSKDHGLIDIQPYEDGTYMAKFDDGSSDKFTNEEMKQFFGVDPDRFQQENKDVSLHATDHPEHIAQMYLDKLHELNDTGNPESAIAQYGPRVSAKHFSDVNDKNNITPAMRMNYFKSTDGKSIDLHDQADEINNIFFGGNAVVHAEDIANFMIKYPAGERTFFTASGNDALGEISDRYSELNNGKKLSKAVAEKIIADFNKADKIISEQFHSPQNVDMINEILTDAFGFEEGRGISAEDWGDKMNSQFDEYVKDPSESFNIFHPVFDGAELSEDQIKKVHEFITEQQNGLTPGGRSDDQLAEQSEGAGLGGENTTKTAQGADISQAAGGAEGTQAAERDERNGNSQESVTEDDDIPFQKSVGEELPPEKVDLAKGLLQKVFPGIETNFHEDVDSFKKALEKNDINVNSDNLPNAFVGKDGVIHFNPEKINGDTQLHEYGHILTSWAEKFAPKLYERMQRFGSEAKGIHAELRENGYNLSGKRMNDEAFVTMLGREGAGSLDEAIKNSGTRGVVKSFINDVWNKFQRFVLEKTGFDISKFKNIKNMGIGDFMNTLNSKYLLSGTEISKVKGEDLANENSLQIKKPERSPGETMAEYARRLGEWKRDFYNNPAGRTRNELNRLLAPVRQKLAELNRSFAEGVKKAKGDTKAAFLEYDAFRKSKEKERLSDLKDKWQSKLTAEKTASAGKLEKSKADTKQAFLEYDAAKKGENKKRIQELRANYQDKLDEEKRVRQEQTQKLQDGFKNIRTEISGTLESLRKSGLLGGVKFSDRDVLAFANQVNKVTTERGLDHFKDFVSRAATSVDYLRDLGDNKKLIGQAKELLKKDYVPANMKGLIRELTQLNPNRVESPKELKTILQDINDSLRAKQIPLKSESDINDFINKEHAADIKQRASDVMSNHTDIENSPEHTAVSTQVGSSLPAYSALYKEMQRIIRNPDLTQNEKARKIGEVNDALDAYHKDVRGSIDPITNEVTRAPQDFDEILKEIRTGDSNVDRESLRTQLEDMTQAKQDAIQIDPDMSPEQKESLETLKNVPLAGEDANTLRLYNNVLENVILNDNHDGIGLFEAKAIGNSDEGALKVVNYLKETGRSSKDASFGTFGNVRKAAIDLSVMLHRIANNDNTFLTKLTTGTYFDQIKNGFTKGKQAYHDVFSSPLEKIFKENPDLAKSADSAHRLTLFSYINQHREFSSDEQQDRELQKRIKTIYKDIDIKMREGLKATQDEGAREQRIFSEFEDKIKDRTGLDIRKPEDLAQLTYQGIKTVPFLSDGEQKAYDTIRAADDKLRPDHEQVVKRQLNKPYETWDNHMRDSYRLLNSGLTNVTAGEDLGFNAAKEDDENGSGASMQRVKGDPLAQKEAKDQRVLAMNFFQNQGQSIKDMLYDIHTLKNRQIFDTALKNGALRDALGNENHQLYKDSIKAYVMNEMGLNKGMGVPELKLVNKGLNIIGKLGASRQLFSLLAHPKHYFSNIFNTVATIGVDGPKLLAQAHNVMDNPDVQELIKQHPISERADNLASLNMTSNENRSDSDIEGDKSWTKTALNASEDAINHWLLGINPDGTSNERLIAKPIKLGDTKSAEWAWVTYYGKHLIDSGKAKDFNSIDWNKENATPDREAADYAENMTSNQMNENAKGGRSKLLSSDNTAFVAGKYLLFPFGSRNMHNLQTLVENVRTLASKDTIVDKDYRSNQANAAAHSILGVLAQEAVFQGVRLAGTLGFAYAAKKGLTYLLANLFADDKEKKALLDKVDMGIQKQKDQFLHQWLSETTAGMLFSGLGQEPQQFLTKGINKITGSDAFFEPNISVNQQVQDSNNLGMVGSAFTGLGDVGKDVYRTIDNNDKYGVPVHIDPYQKAVFGLSLLSNSLAMAGLNDANLNRSIDAMRKQVEFSLASKFHEPNYEDLSAPGPIKIGSKVIMLAPDHQTYYEQVKEAEQNKLTARGYDSKRAATMASRIAKAELVTKFGYPNVIKEGKVKK